MSEHTPHAGLGYETQEPDFRIIVLLIPVSLLFVIIFTVVCCFAAHTSLSSEMDVKQAQGAELAGKKLETFEARQDSSMHAYGWMDKKKGMVRIPIDEAMQMMAKKNPSPNSDSSKAK